MCEPQGVSTAATYSGEAGSLMSKTRTPSHAALLLAGSPVLAHDASERLESTLRISRSPHTEMSFCAPVHTTWVTCSGWAGVEMSQTVKPS